MNYYFNFSKLTRLLNNQSHEFNIETDGIYYALNPQKSTVSVVCGKTKYKDDIIIPDYITYNGKQLKVTNIGTGAFYDCKQLTNIVIPNTVQEIGCKAFYHCKKLEHVNIPSNVVKIQDKAFYKCKKLHEITIPASVTRIGFNGFGECKSLTALKFEDTNNECSCSFNNSKINNYAFSNAPIKQLYIGRPITGFHGWKRDDLCSLTLGRELTIWKKTYCSKSIKEIHSMIANPDQLIPHFDDETILKATLYVPKGTKKVYTNTKEWSNFFDIQEKDL